MHGSDVSNSSRETGDKGEERKSGKRIAKRRGEKKIVKLRTIVGVVTEC